MKMILTKSLENTVVKIIAHGAVNAICKEEEDTSLDHQDLDGYLISVTDLHRKDINSYKFNRPVNFVSVILFDLLSKKLVKFVTSDFIQCSDELCYSALHCCCMSCYVTHHNSTKKT